MKKPSSQQVLKFIKGYGANTFAGAMNAISLYTFVNPQNLVAGGFSGLATVISRLIAHWSQFSVDNVLPYLYFGLNLPLLICSLIFLRGDFTFKTIWATISSSVVMWILDELPWELKFSGSPLIAVIFGGIIIGTSMYIANIENGSNGGTEIIGQLVTKYRPERDISKVILFSNIISVLLGCAVTIWLARDGENYDANINIVLYSFIYVFLGSTVMGILKRGFNHPQKFLIITTEYERLGELITEKFARGYTCVDVTNSYDGKQRKMIAVVVQYRQMYALKHMIKTVDSHSFTIVKDVYDVFSRPSFNRSYKTK